MIVPIYTGRGYRFGMAYSVTDLRILRSHAGYSPLGAATKSAEYPLEVFGNVVSPGIRT